MNSLSLSSLTLQNQVSKVDSSLNIYEDPNGSFYCLKKVENSLASDRFSFLTTLKHPCLLKYYHLTDQQNGEVAEEYCPFGTLSDLIQAQHKFSSNDLWCILTQLVYLFDFLLNKEVTIKELTVVNVFVSSLNPICLKVSLLSPTQSLSYEHSQSFCIQVEEAGLGHSLLDRLLVEEIRRFFGSFVDLITSSFLITSSNDDVKTLLRLTSKVVDLKGSKSITTCFAQYYASLFQFRPFEVTCQLFFSKTLIYHVFTQGILKFRKPLLQFHRSAPMCSNKDFSIFASKIINVSWLFRNEFLGVFQLCSKKGGHIVVDSLTSSGDHCMIQSSCSSHIFFSNNLTCVPTIISNWFTQLPITSVSTHSLKDIPFSLFCVNRLELIRFRDGLSPTQFPNLTSLSLHGISKTNEPFLSCLSCFDKLRLLELHSPEHHNLNSVLIAEISQLTFLQLYRFIINDLTPLASLPQLTKLSLKGCKLYDLQSLQHLPNLSYLDLRETPLSWEHQRVVCGRAEVKKVVYSYKDLVRLDLSHPCARCGDLSRYIIHSNLKVLNLANTSYSRQYISQFKHLETLNLSSKKGSKLCSVELSFSAVCLELRSLSLDGCLLYDVHALSSLVKMETLSLRYTRISNLWPLHGLTKLSSLDVRDTSLGRFHQVITTGVNEVQAVVRLYDPQSSFTKIRSKSSVVHIELCPNVTRIRLLNVALSRVYRISMISNFINLEYMDLSGVRIRHNNQAMADYSFLAYCVKLKSVVLDGSDITDLSPISFLTDLTQLYLSNTRVFDLTPLLNLSTISTLDVRETFLHKEHHKVVVGIDKVTSFLLNFEDGVELVLAPHRHVDLNVCTKFLRVRSFISCNNTITHPLVLSKFVNLETLDLTGAVFVFHDSKILFSVVFLSSCVNLKSLTLNNTRVYNLKPLSRLTELTFLSLRNTRVFDLSPLLNLSKLSTLDVRNTMLPEEHQILANGLSEVKTLVACFQRSDDVNTSTSISSEFVVGKRRSS
ncbi:hypothetical protein RCL1_007666 [Eukaryota sp. TZLM3-RCL]